MSLNTIAAGASPLTIFRDYLHRGELAYQFDTATGQPVFFPRVIAPGTGNAVEWRVSEGMGTVYAATVISPRGEPPYNVVLVDMDEGFRLMSCVDEVPADAVRIGMRVRSHVHLPSNGAAPHVIFSPEAA